MTYNLQEVKKQVEAGEAKLLDVREQMEWDQGHLKNSQLAPLSQLEQGQDPENLGVEELAYTHCRAGHRSFVAADILKARGFTNIVALSESYEVLAQEEF